MTLYVSSSEVIAADSPGSNAIVREGRPMLGRYGFTKVMYFHCVPAWEGAKVLVAASPEMQEFAEYYVREELECPFLVYALQAQTSFCLADAPFPPLTPKIEAAVSKMTEIAGEGWMERSLGVPVFGPMGRKGVFLIFPPAGSPPLDRAAVERDIEPVHLAFCRFKLAERHVLPPLSPDHQQTLALTARGYCHKRIAREMGITPAAAKWRQRRVRETLGCENITAAVAKATALGLIV